MLVPTDSFLFDNVTTASLVAPAQAVANEERYRDLTSWEIEQLVRQGCTSSQWYLVRVAPTCDLRRLQGVHFVGRVRLGNFDTLKKLTGGLSVRTGIYNAHLENVTVGDNVLIRNVHQGICNYDIEDEVVITDVGLIGMDGESRFGNGQMVNVLREDGNVALPIFDRLSSNLAHLMVSAADPAVRHRTRELIERYADQVASIRGRIGRQATLTGCGQIINTWIGPAAELSGVARLSNCTLSSTPESPVFVGEGVQMSDSIAASGSKIDSGALVTKSFVGQGVRVERQFSAQDSLLFANTELAHGEACSVFAGPFTVSHHKSTLLIASEASFFNAGSGTNQSNHAYKTGPVHCGILERGCKTGSSSCVAWPARVGAFSTVLGRHGSGFDTTDFPFSYLVESHRHTRLIPALNLHRIGLWRDERKWQSRDRRTGTDLLDVIDESVFSPWAIDKMRRARDLLSNLAQSTAVSGGEVVFAGVRIRRADLAPAVQCYDNAVRRGLAALIVQRLESHGPEGLIGSDSPAGETNADWREFGGMFALRTRIETLIDRLAAGHFDDLAQLLAAVRELSTGYDDDCWSWCVQVWQQETGTAPASLDVDELRQVVEQWRDLSLEFLAEISADAHADVTDSIAWNHNAYGNRDGHGTDAREAERHPLLRELSQEREAIINRASRLLDQLESTASLARCA